MARILTVFGKTTLFYLLIWVTTSQCSLSLDTKLKNKNVQREVIWTGGESFGDVSSSETESHSIKKREAKSTDSSIITNENPLNDPHNQLVVLWAGEDVIICLAKDMNMNTTSTLYISRDYGGKFLNVSDKLLIANSRLPTLDKFFNHHRNNGHFIFTDVVNKYIFTTTDYGNHFQAFEVPFVPDEISFDPHSDQTVVAFESDTINQEMWLSQDFGKTWTKSHQNVKAFEWDDSVIPARLFLQRMEPGGSTILISSDSLFIDPKDTKVEIKNVEEFKIKDEYMFATKRITDNNLELLISYQRGPFQPALFPNKNPAKDFHIADVTDGQIFVCVTHSEHLTNLYIGNEPLDNSNPRFSLSLERIVFFKPNVSWPGSWINDVTGEAFVDLHRVDGLRGVYIASQLKSVNPTNGKFNMDEVISLVTYDQGAEWTELEPPDFDDEGQPLYCKLTNGRSSERCSLHISQRLSELYPMTRAVPILSKKSAVGIVLATGTVNSSLKGHLGVYMSTDGAVKWRQLLKGNYLYNFGDHGGIIVATKYYKVGDATNELIYSTDEGQSWTTYQFSENKIRVLGLMTEPGENTTVFFIFGSVSNKTKHSWMLIKVDFKNVFERSCTVEDYKMWSPWDSKPGRHCLLGRKDVYERRIASHKCHNGGNYVREMNSATCSCGREDFECDYGYKLDLSQNSTHCIHDDEVSISTKPTSCVPGERFYNRTKGYRKIPADVCVDGVSDMLLPERVPCTMKNESQFLLVAKRDSILRIDMNDFTIRDSLPIPQSEAIIALDFDRSENTVFWSDVNQDRIMKLRLDGESEPEILLDSNLLSVEGLAFDWMSKNLYLCDGASSKIEVIRTNILNVKSTRKVILGKPEIERPRGIAVHPAKGFLFWSDWSEKRPVIGRSWLDGSNVRYIIQNSNGDQIIKWPNGITVDYATNKLYWVDADLDRMSTCGMEGENHKVFLPNDNRLRHPFAVAAYKNLIYWDDWITRSIYFASSDVENATSTINLVAHNLPRLMDMKAYGPESQLGTNKCSNSNNGCPYLCLSMHGEGSTCHCPDGFNVSGSTCICSDGKPVNNDSTCGMPDDKDSHGLKCSPVQFLCKIDGRCVPETFRCDFDLDCSDGADEENCDDLYPKCNDSTKFKCDNKRCIMQKWVCDGEDDCHDSSDEKNCPHSHRTSCLPNEFKCASNNRCISNDYVCDGTSDCDDHSDEKPDYCANRTCQEWKFECGSKDCIIKSWVCDGDSDCKDGSDEKNCSGSPMSTAAPPIFPQDDCSKHPDMFKCYGTDQCLPSSWLCDSVQDCNDGSDELGCEYEDEHRTTPATVTFRPAVSRCPDDHWQCNSGECIWEASLCDGHADCPGKEDEVPCHNGTRGCPKDHRRCGLSNVCVKSSKFCDGIADCPNKLDELACSSDGTYERAVCNSGQFLCPEGVCIPKFRLCNKNDDCFDGADETNCVGHKTIYQVEGISADLETMEADHFKIEWWLPPILSKDNMEFIPSFKDIVEGSSYNGTATKDRSFTFGHEHGQLKAFTKYSVTVYVKVDGKVYPPAVYVNVTTAEKEPTEPVDLVAMQNTTDQLCLSWKRPYNPNGVISIYRVYFQPPVPPAAINSAATDICISNKQSDPVFIDGQEYQFWVVAENLAGMGPSSNVVKYTFNANVPEISDLKIAKISEHSVTVNWAPMRNQDPSDRYEITLAVVNPVYPLKQKQSSTTSDITFANLAPGTKYKMSVLPIRKNIQGSPVPITFSTKGEGLPKLSNLTAFAIDQGKELINVTWLTPEKAIGSIYGVYYGKSTKEISDKGARLNTTSNSITISDMESCETYLIDVGIVGPNGIGPLTETPRLISTGMRDTSSPKDLRIKEVDEVDMTILLSWKAPCSILNKSIGYNITMEEMTVHHKYTVNNVAFSTNPEVEYSLGIHYGGRYRVIVSTSVPNGKPSLPVTFEGPSIPYPQQLQVCSECNIMTIYWSKPAFPQKVTEKGNVSYIVWLSKDESFESKSTRKYKTTELSHTFNDILEEEMVYYVAVSAQDADGLESPRSQAISLQQIESSSQISISTGNALGIGVTIFVVVVLLASALGVFVVRHRRLQTSFLNFASSHYSTRSGSATFQQAIEEEQDSPVIRGFSDDEPLLIA